MKTLSSSRITEFSYPDSPFITESYKCIIYIGKESKVRFFMKDLKINA
jgi:hypothetical protein